jgi:hypothetical protein
LENKSYYGGSFRTKQNIDSMYEKILPELKNNHKNQEKLIADRINIDTMISLKANLIKKAYNKQHNKIHNILNNEYRLDEFEFTNINQEIEDPWKTYKKNIEKLNKIKTEIENNQIDKKEANNQLKENNNTNKDFIMNKINKSNNDINTFEQQKQKLEEEIKQYEKQYGIDTDALKEGKKK